ncbi:MAG TPA: MFS transporter [Caldilineaceae bacterium]|nr:MFS transporter [Caldilineaceae bacterium]HRW09974.1 MFS transporter [Caldilineaceae bacterium]
MASTNLLAPSTRRRITGTLFAAHTTFVAAQIASFTLLSIIGAQLAGSDASAGIPSTISMVGRALAGYPIGWLMDKLGRRTGLSLGYLLALIGGIISVYSIGQESLIGFCLGAGLAGMARSTSEQSRYIAAEAELPDRRAKAIGLIVAGGTIAAVVGPLFVRPSGIVMTGLGFLEATGPYAVSALLSLICLILVFTLLRPDPLMVGRAIEDEYGTPASKAQRNEKGRTFLQALIDPRVKLALAALMISQFVMTYLMVIMPVHMNHHNHGTGAISMMISSHSLGMYVFSWLTGWLIERTGRVSVIVLGGVTLALSAIFTPVWVGAIPLSAIMFIVGLGWNFAFIAGSSLLSDALTQNERGRIQGASETLIAVAGGTGSLSSGLVFSATGVMGLSGVGLAFSAALLVAALLWGRTQFVTTLASDA